MTYARSVFVVHNIAHQGRGPMAELAPLEVPASYAHCFRLDDPIGGVHMNVMKAGLMAAHRVIAVSHGRGPRAGLRRPRQSDSLQAAPSPPGLHRHACTSGG